MPRLVRRAPISERVKAYLDPYDLLLWLSEEWNDDTYDELLNTWATTIGIALNFLFILARGASRSGGSGRGRDDVFGDTDGPGSSGWFAWLAAFLVHFLTVLCGVNAVAAFFRKRHYRLFEQPVDEAPTTPSARRVRVDSSPMSSSPLRYLQQVIANGASARAYPDAEREVWELSVWDPKPFNLTLFTLFSPGHLLLYYSLLPPATLDPRPSVTVVSALGFGALLSLQLGFLRTSFSQQAKDSALVHGEVLNEYDAKYVRPSLNRPVRDVAIQTRESALAPRGTKTREVDVYTPTTIINRGFRTNPNPNYARHYDPDNLTAQQPSISRRTSGVDGSTTPSLTPTPLMANGHTRTTSSRHSTTAAAAAAAATTTDFSSPLKPHHERLRDRSPAKRESGSSSGGGGSMGVYSHANSPLRKARSSSNFLGGGGGRPTMQQQDGKVAAGSPLKRVSMFGGDENGSGNRRGGGGGRY